jgi:integrase
MPGNSRKKRVPKLKYTDCRGIGWHVSYRDPETGTPRRHRFGMVSLAEAESAYHEWVAAHLRGDTPPAVKHHSRRKLDEHLATPKAKPGGVPAEILPGSLLHITSGFFAFEESRLSEEGRVRRRGTITRKTCDTRKQFAREFLKYLNSRNGQGAVGRMKLVDLTMQDVEAYNRLLVSAGYSSSQVTKRLQVVKAIIDRGGRPEYGQQLLAWNWESRDVSRGKPATPRKLPTLTQLKLVLRKCDAQRRAMIWMAIGCGFGQRDLAEVRVGQFDEIGYDLRRGKTGIERYGETPKIVWQALQEYLAEVERPSDGLLFLTRKGMPLVHGHTDSVVLWWTKLREALGEAGEGLGGFYTLRHLGATEFGSRPGCSIGAMRRWLGHSASSQMADVYMKPVSPEDRQAVEWVRAAIASGKADLRVGKSKK